MSTTPVKPRGFQPGHPRYGGRQRSPAKRLRQAAEVIEELSERLGFDCDPFAQLLLIGSDKEQPIEIRMKALIEAQPFCRPKLQATLQTELRAEITDVVSITDLLQNPDLAEAAQKLAFSMAESEQPLALAPGDADPVCIPAPAENEQ